MNSIVDSSTSKTEGLFTHVQSLLSKGQCEKLTRDYDTSIANRTQIAKSLSNDVFCQELSKILSDYFLAPFQVPWVSFDRVDSSQSDTYYSSRWHLDHGIPGTLKLLVYLNGVSEHQGNTLIYDRFQTEKLKSKGLLPVNFAERKDDLTDELKMMGAPFEHRSFELMAGDGVLFDPCQLAHRCQLPVPGRSRYSLSYTIVPGTDKLQIF